MTVLSELALIGLIGQSPLIIVVGVAVLLTFLLLRKTRKSLLHLSKALKHLGKALGHLAKSLS